jgi:hypothetical protein
MLIIRKNFLIKFILKMLKESLFLILLEDIGLNFTLEESLEK